MRSREAYWPQRHIQNWDCGILGCLTWALLSMFEIVTLLGVVWFHWDAPKRTWAHSFSWILSGIVWFFAIGIKKNIASIVSKTLQIKFAVCDSNTCLCAWRDRVRASWTLKGQGKSKSCEVSCQATCHIHIKSLVWETLAAWGMDCPWSGLDCLTKSCHIRLYLASVLSL